VLDVAKLYPLVLEKGQTGARYHAVAEEGVAAREIAEVVGAGLGVPVVSLTPEEAPQHFGWLGMFVDMDLPASSAKTRELLGWQPTGPSLIEDLQRMDYSRPAAAE
jgi:nucleoside-diphosphate-sugar epimerase